MWVQSMIGSSKEIADTVDTVGILHARVSDPYRPQFGLVHLEFHVTAPPKGGDQAQEDVKAHVQNVVLRVRIQRLRELMQDFCGGAENIAAVDGYMLQYRHLRSLVLETTDMSESDELAEKLILSRMRGVVRQRTCAEACAVAERMTSGRSKLQEVVSPFWYVNKPENVKERSFW